MKNPIFILLAIGFAASCSAPPKALIIAEAPKNESVKETAAVEPSVESPIAADDGLRMPDMLALPDEGRLRSASTPEGSGDATVITRPPAE